MPSTPHLCLSAHRFFLPGAAGVHFFGLLPDVRRESEILRFVVKQKKDGITHKESTMAESNPYDDQDGWS